MVGATSNLPTSFIGPILINIRYILQHQVKKEQINTMHAYQFNMKTTKQSWLRLQDVGIGCLASTSGQNWLGFKNLTLLILYQSIFEVNIKMLNPK